MAFITKILGKILGNKSERDITEIGPVVEQVKKEYERIVTLTNDQLREETFRLKALVRERIREEEEEIAALKEKADEVEIQDSEKLYERIDKLEEVITQKIEDTLNEILPVAFAIVKETASRFFNSSEVVVTALDYDRDLAATRNSIVIDGDKAIWYNKWMAGGNEIIWDMVHYDVQLIGGVVLHQGKIAEMATGEGKTLVATLPVFLNALAGRGVHIVTVNDYLSKRDSEWMGPIFEFHGLSVDCIDKHQPNSEARRKAYNADITYGTNNEFGFDYLRDNMAIRPESRVQRPLNYAIVDEIDSILIDEARTPLIISGRPEKSTDLYYKVDEAVRKLRKGTHYELEEKGHHVLLSEEGMAAAERLLGVEDLYVDDSLGIVHMVQQAIRAHNFYKIDDEYVVRNGEVLIVDEFTGRMMEGRRFSDGLHQALEAKERVAVQFETQTVATVTYQNLFKLYKKIGGMTGTAATEAVEFATIYNLDVVQVPTNLPLIRNDLTDLVFATELGKFRHVVQEIARIHESGRPILVG
ncbi:MAG TPA: preprotein translocase subunit SecA, partial [Prolixibacteraceae bacterium]|nr:preprotein translocase subunit SecA [Prolixibacteraceae bacterium]